MAPCPSCVAPSVGGSSSRRGTRARRRGRARVVTRLRGSMVQARRRTRPRTADAGFDMRSTRRFYSSSTRTRTTRSPDERSCARWRTTRTGTDRPHDREPVGDPIPARELSEIYRGRVASADQGASTTREQPLAHVAQSGRSTRQPCRGYMHATIRGNCLDQASMKFRAPRLLRRRGLRPRRRVFGPGICGPSSTDRAIASTPRLQPARPGLRQLGAFRIPRMPYVRRGGERRPQSGAMTVAGTASAKVAEAIGPTSVRGEPRRAQHRHAEHKRRLLSDPTRVRGHAMLDAGGVRGTRFRSASPAIATRRPGLAPKGTISFPWTATPPRRADFSAEVKEIVGAGSDDRNPHDPMALRRWALRRADRQTRAYVNGTRDHRCARAAAETAVCDVAWRRAIRTWATQEMARCSPSIGRHLQER